MRRQTKCLIPLVTRLCQLGVPWFVALFLSAGYLQTWEFLYQNGGCLISVLPESKGRARITHIPICYL
ncbi:MAG: hypothetical protein A2527_03695 [Candidatus Lambdaproteobacteria bacterium RIFOXYD2_FULL_50_16]|uniref:Uncharacterized protein n=1 Tax=Candidatus Lambdaproteobacteria bacterium RIFOXYD2_FULL_50_16 TaxID=1817772 RepID=A0A1F6GEY7_9PROT|nr:MAG: hypothetical protein A2527_03695 [Candidatus Lambdaproteobacteria bacterium RIFOXYD2_FULL_50_16]